MACPALPLCGLAVTEAERGLPAVNVRIRTLLNKLGFGEDETLVVSVSCQENKELLLGAFE